MRPSLFCLTALLLIQTRDCLAKEASAAPVATVDWAQLKEAGNLMGGEVVPSQDGAPARLKIVNTAAGATSIPLCEIKSPTITTASYAVRGKISYDNVVGTGYLEMWNHFPGGGQYFTRTLDTGGPMSHIKGTSPEREFILPFHTLGQAPAPTKLVINLILNGPGTIEIGPLELIPIDSMTATNGADWWSGSTGGLVGGLGGAFMGLMGAVIGILTGLGKGKKLVLGLSGFIAVAGTLELAFGIVAVSTGQPYSIYYPLLFMGSMMIITGTTCLCLAPSRFRSHELRRMQALDLS
jgi:hypothetical protein